MELGIFFAADDVDGVGLPTSTDVGTECSELGYIVAADDVGLKTSVERNHGVSAIAKGVCK